MFINRFRLFNDTPGESGSTPAVDRGDLLIPEDQDLDPDNPDAKLDAPEVDPKVAELEAEVLADAEKEDKRDSRIPQSRHKEILEKERAKTAALAAEVAQLKQRSQVADTGAAANADFAAIEADVLKLEEDYANLLTDGEIKKATAVMAKIRQAERHMAEVKADLKIQTATIQARESAQYQTVLSRIEAAFPVLNPDHDDYNQATELRVIKMSRMNQQDGMTPSAALQDAVDTIIGVSTAKQEAATTVTPRVDPGAVRKAAAAATTTKAITKTPPSLSRSGLDSDKLGGGESSAAAVISMSQKEFAQLSDAALAKLRGDEL